MLCTLISFLSFPLSLFPILSSFSYFSSLLLHFLFLLINPPPLPYYRIISSSSPCNSNPFRKRFTRDRNPAPRPDCRFQSRRQSEVRLFVCLFVGPARVCLSRSCGDAEAASLKGYLSAFVSEYAGNRGSGIVLLLMFLLGDF